MGRLKFELSSSLISKGSNAAPSSIEQELDIFRHFWLEASECRELSFQLASFTNRYIIYVIDRLQELTDLAPELYIADIRSLFAKYVSLQLHIKQSNSDRGLFLN